MAGSKQEPAFVLPVPQGNGQHRAAGLKKENPALLEGKRWKTFFKASFSTLKLYFSSNLKHLSSWQEPKGRQGTREAPTVPRAKIYLLSFGGQDFPRLSFLPRESPTDRGPRKRGRFHREASLGKRHHLVTSLREPGQVSGDSVPNGHCRN